MNISQFSSTGYFFLHNIPDIVVATSEPGQPTSVVVKVDGNVIFDETIYTDSDGKCMLCDVPSLLEPYIKGKNNAIVSINNNNATVFYCRLPIKAFYDEKNKVPDWMKVNFLSPITKKIVSDKDTICLTATNAVEQPLYLVITGAYYEDGFYMTKSVRSTITPKQNITEVVPLVFSLEQVQKAIAVNQPLIGFSIALNLRIYKFFRMKGNPAITIRYNNSFGQPEFLSLQGILVTKPDIIYTQASINGKVHNLKVESETIYQMQTGPVDKDTLAAIRDMVESEDTYLVEDGIDYPIIFENADLSFSNDKSELQGVQFSFRRCKDRGLIIESFTENELIFSEQFDWTFN